MGVFYTCYYAAMTGLVPVAGFLRDALDSAPAPLNFGAAMMLLAAVSLAGSGPCSAGKSACRARDTASA